MQVYRGRIAPLDLPYTFDAYGQLIARMLTRGYRFASFTAPKVEADQCTAFLRHDIDYSLVCALDMAAINAAHGVSGTFFVRVRSTSYNLFSPVGQDALRRLVHEHGQRVALHFSVDGGALQRSDLLGRLRGDFELLTSVVPEAEPVFSWHNPASTFEDGTSIMQAEFAGFVNAYAPFAGCRPRYVAESNMRYTIEELCAIIDEREPVLQICFAPIQWASGKTNMVDALAAALVQKLRDALPEFEGNYVFQDLYGGRLTDSTLAEVENVLRRQASVRPS